MPDSFISWDQCSEEGTRSPHVRHLAEIGGVLNAVLSLSCDASEITVSPQSVQDCHDIAKLIVNIAKKKSADFSTCRLLLMYKRNQFLFDSLSGGAQHQPNVKPHMEDVRRKFHNAVCAVKSLIGSSKREGLRVIEILCEFPLLTVRMVATFVCVYLACISREFTESLFPFIECRTRDVNPVIRRLACVEGIFASGLLKSESFASVIKSTLLDTDVRMYFLLRLDRMGDRIGQMYSGDDLPILGDWLVRIAFETTDATCATLAVDILRKSCHLLIRESDEESFQLIANLIWQWMPLHRLGGASGKRSRDTVSEKALSTPIAAIMFVNEHILANPGLFSPNGSKEQKLLVLTELIDQYSDGLVFPLTGRLVHWILRIHRNTASSYFLSDPKVFAKCIDSCLESCSDGGITFKRRLNGMLEILFCVCIQTEGLTQFDGFASCVDLLSSMIRVLQNHDPLESVSDIMFPTSFDSDSQSRIVDDIKNSGIVPRRENAEIVSNLVIRWIKSGKITGLDNRQSERCSPEILVDILSEQINSLL